MKNLTKHCLVFAVALNASAAHAAPIGGNDIIPSTTLPTLSNFTINQINDGITLDRFPFNGFASPATRGTISLDLVGEFDLSSFLLWNDINVRGEGIRNFRLDFFDGLDALIPVSFPTTFVAPFGQVAPEEYVFNSIIPRVSRVNLEVLSSYNLTGINRIEVREVAFTGTRASVPETSSILGTGVALGFGMLCETRRRKYKLKVDA